ncbi:hypothetical protein AN958_08029 [Leucoagaricus sp. SymC.cos]|nr:hypothetical protein AN958_08029 [Leucoagaricus sp. SymC.cos]
MHATTPRSPMSSSVYHRQHFAPRLALHVINSFCAFVRINYPTQTPPSIQKLILQSRWKPPSGYFRTPVSVDLEDRDTTYDDEGGIQSLDKKASPDWDLLLSSLTGSV